MPVLYVTEPGATLRVAHGIFRITAESGTDGGTETIRRKEVMLEVQPHRLEVIGLVGRVHVTRDALLMCLEKGISLAWFAWNGVYQGRLSPGISRSGDLRLAQSRLALSAESSLALARTFIRGKCVNGRAVLRGIQSNQAGVPELSLALKELGEWEERIVAATDPEELLGCEGGASRCYFSVLDHGFRGEIRFSGRKRRPPPDPANALLSFGYVLLGNQVAGLLEGRGLDPSIGFFHAPRPGRASLALDLLEEFRHPVVDRFVLRTCNLRMIRPEMFETDPETGGIRLTREGLKVFFSAWGHYLERPFVNGDGERTSVNDLLRQQVNLLAMAIRGEREYVSFRLREND
ncbi:MAG: CRISPR-associated endonuclease Cas1 [Magnetococcales bacterium]|nr:CRISPR-associated endonuclease Cas1 [Magnetococcales bacterium]